jgi:acyl-CoA reductase-like NAD-dependent aldehyde dehydrogenase
MEKSKSSLAFFYAMKVAGQLRTGVTFFNNRNATAVDERAVRRFNASGIGRELGRQGMHVFTETHVMAVPSEP